jgi:hypothetical protein
LKSALSGIEQSSPDLIRFLRYSMLGAWMTIGAPWVFIALGLADRETSIPSAAANHSASV